MEGARGRARRRSAAGVACRGGCALLPRCLIVLIVCLGLGATEAGAARAIEPSPPAGPRLGVNIDPWGMSPEALDASLTLLGQLGVSALRLPYDWSAAQPAPDSLQWEATDRVLKRLEAGGFEVLLGLRGAPEWARSDPAPPDGLWLCDLVQQAPERLADAAPPSDAADLAAFTAALLTRHGSRIAAIEVWHEPNILPGWRATGPDPEDYAALLLAVASAARATAPEVAIVSAALAPVTIEASPVCYMSDLVFLDRLARSGALSAVDAVGLQPFGLEDAPDTAAAEDRLNFRRAELAQAILERHRVERPLWALAWGWALDTGGAEAPWGRHPAEAASTMMQQAWARASRDWPWMERMYLWQWQPRAATEDPAWGFALRDPSGAPSALWPAFEAVVQAAQAPPARAARADGHPIGSRAKRLGLLGLLGLLALGAAGRLARPGAWLDRQRPALASRLRPLERRSLPVLALGFGLALGLNALAPWPLAAAGLVLMCAIALARPELALAALAAGLPFYYAFPLQLGPRPVALIELLLAILLGARLARIWLEHGLPFSGRWSREGLRSPSAKAEAIDGRPRGGGWLGWRQACSRRGLVGLDLAPLLLVVWAGLSPLWAEHPGPARYEWRTVILEPVLLYFLLRGWPDRRSAARSAMDGLLFGAVLAAMLGLFGLAVTGLGLQGPLASAVAAEGVLRARGPYGSPNNLALWLGRALPIALAMAFLTRGRRRELGRLAALLLAAGMLATFSRGAAILGLPLLGLYLLATLRPRLGRPVLLRGAAMLLALAGLLLPFATTERLRGTLDLSSGSTAHIRLRLWQSALRMIRDHPWTGLGLDNFLYAYRDRYVARDVIQERALSHPHNGLLDWWTRLGLPGLAIFVWLVAGNVAAGRRALAASSEAGSRALVVGALGVQVYALAHGLVDNHFFLVDLASAWWIAQAALLAFDPASVEA